MKKQTAALLSFVFALAFAALLAVLHFLEPGRNLGGHLISEYELSRYGWLMSLAFFSLGAASLLLLPAIRVDLRGIVGSIGFWWLLTIAIAYFGAGIFYPDPSTNGLPLNPSDLRRAGPPTLNATLHGLFGVIVIGSSPVVFTLLERGLTRNPMWSSNMRAIRWATALTWVGLVSLPVSLFLYSALQKPGSFDFRIVVSVCNRFMILTYAGWLAITAAQRTRSTC